MDARPVWPVKRELFGAAGNVYEDLNQVAVRDIEPEKEKKPAVEIKEEEGDEVTIVKEVISLVDSSDCKFLLTLF